MPEASFNKLVKFATISSVVVAVLIVMLKFLAWFQTGSVAILATLFDAVIDLATSSINFFAARYASQPADSKHRFGHGKAEDLAVFLQSSFLLTSCLFIFYSSLQRIIDHQVINNFQEGLALTFISLSLTTILVGIQSFVILKTKSQIVRVDRLHYSFDLYFNFVVIISLLISEYFKTTIADPIVAIGLTLFLASSSWKMLKSSFYNLMDGEIPYHERKKIKEIITSSSQVLGVHDIRTRKSGDMIFVQAHIELDPNISLKNAHDIAENVAVRLKEKIPNIDVIIHQDPQGADEPINFK